MVVFESDSEADKKRRSGNAKPCKHGVFPPLRVQFQVSNLKLMPQK